MDKILQKKKKVKEILKNIVIGYERMENPFVKNFEIDL
jgi:hypothetical protein